MKTRGPQAFPSEKQQREMAKMLTEMAVEGDAEAAGWLLLVSELRKQRVKQNDKRAQRMV